jgi:class 3 adenylate cyclase
VEAPETRYVAVGDADVAYQVVGEGPIDLLYCYGLGSHIELFWEIPGSAEFLSGLAALGRLIFFDRRGTGASDAVSLNAMPTWEEWTEDIVAVLRAAGSKRTAILATLDAGPIAVLFAAMHPEMVSALILLNTSARYLEADDYPVGNSPDALDVFVEMVATAHGTPELTRLYAPRRADDAEYIRLVSKMIRASATPRTAAAQYNYILRSIDVRYALPLIQAPTLVLSVTESPFLSAAQGRYLADHIEGATFIELPGGNVSGDFIEDHVLDDIAEFLTGERPVVEVERILTTVLFTDIVGSTAQAASLGDRRWRSILDAHDRTVREQLRHFRGREINTTGDGFVASFDGPARAIRCAQAICESTEKFGVSVRVGMHTGECEVRGDDLGGLAVHIAARVGALAGPGEVMVSGTVKDLVVGSESSSQTVGSTNSKESPEPGSSSPRKVEPPVTRGVYSRARASWKCRYVRSGSVATRPEITPNGDSERIGLPRPTRHPSTTGSCAHVLDARRQIALCSLRPSTVGADCRRGCRSGTTHCQLRRQELSMQNSLPSGSASTTHDSWP